jgi:glycosyltransferase involved in cell wall biosynthesis
MKVRREPLIPEVGVLAMVPDEWSEQWQSRHHILTRLARYFHVVWINPAQGWRDAMKGMAAVGASTLLAEQPLGFQVYDDRWLPKLYRPSFLAQFTFEQRLQRARRLLVKRGCKKIVLYLWRPEFDAALKAVAHDLSCYHVDDEYSFSDSEVPLSDRERSLLASVDRVFIHSPGLMEKKGWVNPRTSFVPLGVDYEAYASVRPEPSDLAGIPHPRIGYSGWIKKTLDWSLLLQLARQHPEWSFVFVGEAKTDAETSNAIKEMCALRNSYFLGPKSTRELIAYPQHFDVCIMPYRLNDYARYGYPLKLHEYLASGRPSIGTAMRTLEEFSDIVLLPKTAEDWTSAINECLQPAANSKEVCLARRRVARKYDWQYLAALIARTVTRQTRADSRHAQAQLAV